MLMNEYQDLPLAAGASIFGFVGPIPLFPQVNTTSQVKIQARRQPSVSHPSAQRSFYKFVTYLLYYIIFLRQTSQPISLQHIHVCACARARYVCFLYIF